MNNKPDFIDNLKGNSLASALKQVLEVNQQLNSRDNDQISVIKEIRIATAYFSPEGFS